MIDKLKFCIILISLLTIFNVKPFAQEINADDSYSIIFLIDVSASMSGEKIESARNAASQMLKIYSKYNTEFSVMAYSGRCDNPITYKLGFTNDTSNIHSFVNKLSTGNSTPLASAYKIAAEYMLTGSKRGTRKIIVVLGDGADDCGNLENVLYELQNKDMLYQTITAGLETDIEATSDLQTIATRTGGYYTNANPSNLLEVEMPKTYLIPMIKIITGYSRKAPALLNYENYENATLSAELSNAVFKLDSLTYFVHPDNYWGMKITIKDVPYIFSFNTNGFTYYVPDESKWLNGTCNISDNEFTISANIEEGEKTEYRCRVKYISSKRMELCLIKYEEESYCCSPKIGPDDSAFILYFTRLK
jgi:hypothetical protein